MTQQETITVAIFDKDYQISCPANEVQALRDSAFYLDQKMREIKSSGSVLGLDRLAVMAALNITNDFLAADRGNQSAQASLDAQSHSLEGSTLKVDQLIDALKVAGA